MRDGNTREFKQDAVRLVSEQGYNQKEAARNLGIDRGMLARWIKEFQTDESEAFRGRGKLTAEVEASKAQVERIEQRFELTAERFIGDTAYGTAPMLAWLVEEKDLEPHVPV